MKQFFYDLWNDEAKFVGLIRGGMVIAAGGVASGVIPMPDGKAGDWLGYVLPWFLGAGAAAVPAGQKNKPPHFEVKR